MTDAPTPAPPPASIPEVVLVARALGYVYAGGARVGPLDLGIGPGERVVLSGPSGSGKTTVLRLLSGVAARTGWGTVLGEVRIGSAGPLTRGPRSAGAGPGGTDPAGAGRDLGGAERRGEAVVGAAAPVGADRLRDPAELPPAERPRRLGFVAQDPKDQLVCGSVADELGFGPECAGMDPEEVERRILHQATRAGLGSLLLRDPQGLSAGEQQRLVTGAALAAGARLLLLDEPLAHLDPVGADALLAHLRALSDEGVAIVLAEHRLKKVAPWATRQIGLDGGRVVYDGPPIAPDAAGGRTREPGDGAPVGHPDGLGRVVAEASGIVHAFGDRVVLDRVDLALRAGEKVALLGANGVGKSTLLGRLSGRLSAPRGSGVAAGRRSGPLRGAADRRSGLLGGGADRRGAGEGTGWGDGIEVPQDPDLTLFCATVRAELAYGPRDRRLPDDEVAQRVDAVARGLGLVDLLDLPPHGLSRGQRLRVAVGAALTCRPRVLLLDEPTAGQDPEAVERVMQSIDEQLGEGALLFATHDEDLARRWAHRVLRLDGGRLSEEGFGGAAGATTPPGEAGSTFGSPGVEPPARRTGD